MQWIETLTGNYSSSARVVDGTLVISLPQAITPVVWRMELGHVRASALEVRKRDDGTHMLMLKTPKGDVYDIAPFDSRGKAVQALMAVSRAMEHAHGQMRPYAANSSGVTNLPALRTDTQHQAAPKGRFATGVIGTILLLGLIALFLNGPGGSDQTVASGTAGQVSGQGVASTGVPVSADDFLTNRTEQ